MKLSTSFFAALGLLCTASAIASHSTPPGSSPRALGDGTVNVARAVQAADSTTSQPDTNKLDRRILGHIPGDRLTERCRGCKNWIDACVDDCKGGDQGSCYEYCRCEALLGPGCRDKVCQKECGFDLRDEPDINENYCPQGGERRDDIWRRDFEDAEFELVDESSHFGMGRHAPHVPIEHLDDPAAHKGVNDGNGPRPIGHTSIVPVE